MSEKHPSRMISLYKFLSIRFVSTYKQIHRSMLSERALRWQDHSLIIINHFKAIINRHAFYLKHDVSETGLYLILQVKTYSVESPEIGIHGLGTAE
jgi:hypothetical protein